MPLDEFTAMNMRIYTIRGLSDLDLIDDHDDATNPPITDFGVLVSEKIKNPMKDTINGFAGIVATGYVYNIHFNEGIDWDHFMLLPSYVSEPTDAKIALRFNYTETRELFEIKQWIGGKILKDYTESPIDSIVDLTTDTSNYRPSPTCNFGDWH